MAAGPELRSVVRFQRLNLAGSAYPAEKDFDLIFCRNVIIYFDARTKAEVVGRLLGHLAPVGYLLLGHAESINGLDSRVQRHVPSVYSLSPSGDQLAGDGRRGLGEKAAGRRS
jgi:chemotaxis protein methyltransferase CheR